MTYLLSPARFVLYQSQGAHQGLQRKGSLRDIKNIDTKPGSILYSLQHRQNPWKCWKWRSWSEQVWGLGCHPHILHVIKPKCLFALEVSQSPVLEKRYETGAQAEHTSHFHSYLPKTHLTLTLLWPDRATYSLNVSCAVHLQASHT